MNGPDDVSPAHASGDVLGGMESVPPASLGAAVPSFVAVAPPSITPTVPAPTAAVAPPSITPTVPAPPLARVDDALNALNAVDNALDAVDVAIDAVNDAQAGHDSDGGDASDESDVYEVARILDRRRNAEGATEYLIKWKGWGAQHNSWEPRENIMDDEMITEFESKQPKPRSPKPATPKSREGGAAEGADLRDAKLLASLRNEWLTKFKQKDLAIAAGLGVNKISLYIHNKLESVTSRTNVETKLRTFFETMLASGGGAISPTGPLVERKNAAPKPRTACGGGGPGSSGGNGAASDGGAGVSAVAAEAAVSKDAVAEEDDDEEEAWVKDDEDDESEGEGVNRIESLLCQRTFQPGNSKRWLVKWHDVPYSDNTWEKKENFDDELIPEFQWKAGLPFVVSDLIELQPHASTALLERENLLPTPAIRPEEEEESEESEEDEAEAKAEVTEEMKTEEAAPNSADAQPRAGSTLADLPPMYSVVDPIEEQSAAVPPTPPPPSAALGAAEVLKDEAAASAAKTASADAPAPPAAGGASAGLKKAGRASAASGKAASARQRKRFMPPPPFVPDAKAGLMAELLKERLPLEETAADLQAASEALRTEFELPLSSPLVAATAEADAGVFVGIGSVREDRRVRLLLLVPPPPGAAAPDDQEGEAAPPAPRRLSIAFDLTMPKKPNFPSDTDSAEEMENVAKKPAKEEASNEGAAEADGAEPAAEAEAESAAEPAAEAAVETAAEAQARADAYEEAQREVVNSWLPDLQDALANFDRAITTRRLRGLHVAITLPSAPASDDECPAAICSILAVLLAARNSVVDSAPLRSLLKRMATPSSPPARLFWTQRWTTPASTGGKRARPSYKVHDEEDDDDEEDEAASNERVAENFVPFGQIVDASGCTVRATVGCSAGLAAELELWGLSLRGDSAWLVRALRPTKITVLREGERSLVQATLVDADGRGVPSAERLKRAVLYATPVTADINKAVDIQRDFAADPAQQGKAPPLTLQKKELNRFIESITEFEVAERKRAARREEAQLEAEMERGDELDESEVIADGVRRQSYKKGIEASGELDMPSDFDDLSSDDESWGGSGDEGGGGSDGGGGSAEESSSEELSGEDDEEEEEDDGEGGTRKRRKVRDAAKAGRLAMAAEIERSLAAGTKPSGAGAAGPSEGEGARMGDPNLWDDGDSEEDEDYDAKGPRDDDSLGPDSADSADSDSADSDSEGEEGEAADGPIGVGHPRDLLPKLPGVVGDGRHKKLRKELGPKWRFTSRSQLLQLDGIGAKVATKVHAAIVAAAWQVEVLAEPPEGLDMSAPVMAEPGGDEVAKAAEKADEKAARAAAIAARRAAAKAEKTAAAKVEKTEEMEADMEVEEKVASGVKRKEKAKAKASPDAEGTASAKKRRNAISASDRNPSELTEAQRAIEVGSAVRICAGPHEGQEGTVTSVLKAWLHVTVRDGSTANVRRVQLQPLADLAGALAGEEEAGSSSEDTSCNKCGQPTTAFDRLLCDGPSCGVVIHSSCSEQPLEAVPDQDWNCADCTRLSATVASVGAAEAAEVQPTVLADEEAEIMDV